MYNISHGGQGEKRESLFIRVTQRTKVIEASSWHLLSVSSGPETMVHHSGWRLPSGNGTHDSAHDSLAGANHSATVNSKGDQKLSYELPTKRKEMEYLWLSLMTCIGVKPTLVGEWGSRDFWGASSGLRLLRAMFLPKGAVWGRVR